MPNPLGALRGGVMREYFFGVAAGGPQTCKLGGGMEVGSSFLACAHITHKGLEHAMPDVIQMVVFSVRMRICNLQHVVCNL